MPWKCQPQVLFDILAREEVEWNLAANTARLEFQLDLHEGMLGKQEIARPEGSHNQQTKRAAPVGEVRKHIDGRGVRPVEVVEKEHDRTKARDLLEECHDLALHAFL